MNSRSKGKRGEREARDLLTSRDWTILANTSDGTECEDLIVNCPMGTTYSVEIKNRKLIELSKFKRQAVSNANKKKLPWMLMVKLEGTRSWLVWRKHDTPKIWNEKEM